MGWVYCVKHRREGLVLSSPKFVAAAISNESVDPDDVRHIRINSEGWISKNPVDRVFFEKLGFPAHQSCVHLNDRDKSSRKINDRILILKIKKEMRGVCTDCLDDVLPPAHRLTTSHEVDM